MQGTRGCGRDVGVQGVKVEGLWGVVGGVSVRGAWNARGLGVQRRQRCVQVVSVQGSWRCARGECGRGAGGVSVQEAWVCGKDAGVQGRAVHEATVQKACRCAKCMCVLRVCLLKV